jgi:hypothetical protein cdivTM_09431
LLCSLFTPSLFFLIDTTPLSLPSNLLCTNYTPTHKEKFYFCSHAANSRQTDAANSAFSSLVISSSVLPELIRLETPHLAENSYSLANSESSVQELLSSRIHRPDYQPEDFIDIMLTVEIPDASDQETAAFFCMYPILLDLVRSACFDLAPVYPSSHSEFTAYHDGNSVSQTYTVKKSFDWQNAGKVAQNYLRTFDPAPHTSRLNDLAEAFTTDPFYNSAPIYFYQKTATPFTKEDLAKSITVANLQVILQQVVVNVSAK